MEKADVISDKLNDVKTFVKDKSYEHKQQTASETNNLESASPRLTNSAENLERKVNMKARHLNKSNDGPNMSGDADDDYKSRNIEENPSLSSDEYENNKVSVGNHKDSVTRYQRKAVGSDSDGGSPHEEHSEPLEQGTSQGHHTDGVEEPIDVNVCDICGDAGREDLLAVCYRCTDGAEHTYCMKVMMDKAPKGDWLCEECQLEEVKNRQKNRIDTLLEKVQSSDAAVGKVSGKRHADELVPSSSFKKPALEIIKGSIKDIDRGKVKPVNHFSSDSQLGNESTEGPRSPAARPRLQSLRGGFSKSNSFSFSNARSKTKLVDEIVLQRQKSTKERSFHDTIAAKELSKPLSFRAASSGSFGPSGSKVKMLSPNSARVHDLKSLKNIKERSLEKTNSVKLSSSSASLTPNTEVKPLKGDSKTIPVLKSVNRSANIIAEAPDSLGQINKQLPSSPSKVPTASSRGIINSVEEKIVDNSTKTELSKESTNPTDGIKENTTGLKISKDTKNRDNKLKDAIEAALLKKPGIYRKAKVSDQPDESSVLAMNNQAAAVDRVPHSRNAGSLTSDDVASPDWHGQISRSLTSNIDQFKQSNGSSYKQPILPPAEGKHLTAGLSSLDDVALSSPIPDHECIWQGSFEVNRSGRTAEFWDGLQAHLSTSASPRVLEAVNKFPHKILLHGVSRASAWPTQFENHGVKKDNIAIYFFAKDIESYEKSYQVLLNDMIRGDLALIGSINGVELLIFPSNQLPEKSNRWNMLFFLWGVFRGKKKNSLHQIPISSDKNSVPQSVPNDKIPLAVNTASVGTDKHVDLESKVNSNVQNSSLEKSTDIVKVVPASSKELISESNKPSEPRKRTFIIDLSEDDDLDDTSQTDMWRDACGQTSEPEGNMSKKQKTDPFGSGNSNGERPFFPVEKEKTQQKPVFVLDLNESLVGETETEAEADNATLANTDVDGDVKMDVDDVVDMDVDDDVASSLSLSLAFAPPNKEREAGKWQSGGPRAFFRDKVEKQQ